MLASGASASCESRERVLQRPDEEGERDVRGAGAARLRAERSLQPADVDALRLRLCATGSSAK